MNTTCPPHIRNTGVSITLDRLRWLAAATALMSAVPAWAHGKVHAHGVARLDAALEGQTLEVTFESPLDNLLGYERAPRTEAERTAAAALLARLRAVEPAAGMVRPSGEAGCRLQSVDVQAPVLEPAAKVRGGGGGSDAASAHSDLVARYTFQCAAPAALRRIDLGWFEAYPRLKRMEVQWVGPQGQLRRMLQRPAAGVDLRP